MSVGEAIPGVVYPPAARLDRYMASGEMPRSTIAEMLWESMAKHRASIALTTADGDISYGELDAITDRLGAALLHLGLRPLDRVLFQSSNTKELSYALIACFKAGLIPVCTLAAHREKEIGYLGRFTGAKAHIVQADDAKFDLVDFAQQMQPTTGVSHILTMRSRADAGTLRIEDLIAAEDAVMARATLTAIPRDPFQVAIFQLSGGTTGVPKVIPRMHGDYLLNALRTIDVLGYRADDVMFMPMQIIHNACMVCFWLPSLLVGAAFTIAAGMAPAQWADRFRHKPPSFVGLIRPLLPRFEDAITQAPVLESIRAFWSPDSARVLRLRYDRPCYAMFGMSEGLNLYVRPGDPIEAADWTVGRPISDHDEIRLVHPGTDEPVQSGEVGELTCRGPYTLAGYYNAPERNIEAFTPDGFYKSGDLLVTREIAGELFYAFAGRTKDVVDRGSEKINCEEVETAVMSHLAVSGCAVVGMPDPLFGERVCAYVVLRAGQPLPDVPAIQEHLHKLGLAKFKWPERIEPIDTLPQTKVGKLDKAVLRARIKERIEAEDASARTPGETV